MLIVTATNVTPRGVVRKNGTADYEVWVGINQHCIWRGNIDNHIRDNGAGELLRTIANQMDAAKQLEIAMPLLSRMVKDTSPAPTSLYDLVSRSFAKSIDAQLSRDARSSTEPAKRRKKRPTR